MIIDLKTLMEERGLTQEQLSVATGIPQGTISRWVGNKIDRFDRHILETLIDHFDCEIGDLLKREGGKQAS